VVTRRSPPFQQVHSPHKRGVSSSQRFSQKK
jgi:hypothetical protein